MHDVTILASWIEDIFSVFSDKTIYFSMAMVGTILFSIRLAMMLFLGLDGGSDFHTDFHADGVVGHGGDFTIFSMVSILSFMMGAGWLGLTCRIEWGVGPVLSALYASLFGFALMMLSSLALWQMRKLESPGGYDVKDCVGHTGRVYLRIPPTGQGRGQVQITVDGSRKILDAETRGDGIESFASVRVVSVSDDDTLVVERS